MTKRQRKHISDEYRTMIFVRDGFRCRYCHRWQFPWTNPTPEIDHIVPVAGGGRSEMSNYALACRSCNREKGDSLGWQPYQPPLWGWILYIAWMVGRYL